MLNSKVANFLIKREIGSGSFATVYSACETASKEEVAIKFYNEDRDEDISRELAVLTESNGFPGFAVIKAHGQHGNRGYIAMELLGKNISSLLTEYQRFTLKTVLMLADQMISRLQLLHKLGYVHRDIKPENFAMGIGANSNQVYLIDFGLTVPYMNFDKKHMKEREIVPFSGTLRFATINQQRGNNVSRRDDLLSLGYLFVYLIKGELPWMGKECAKYQSNFQDVLAVKLNTPIPMLCEGMPKEFADYINMVSNLEYSANPNYSKYRKMFRELFIKQGFTYDYKFDWISIQVAKKFSFNKSLHSGSIRPDENHHRKIGIRQSASSDIKIKSIMSQRLGLVPAKAIRMDRLVCMPNK